MDGLSTKRACLSVCLIVDGMRPARGNPKEMRRHTLRDVRPPLQRNRRRGSWRGHRRTLGAVRAVMVHPVRTTCYVAIRQYRQPHAPSYRAPQAAHTLHHVRKRAHAPLLSICCLSFRCPIVRLERESGPSSHWHDSCQPGMSQLARQELRVKAPGPSLLR